jgi:L-iditol 2-dehydrogenase
MLKAVKWFAPRDLRVVDVDKPVPKPHEALVHVESVGICGSDLHYYEQGCIGGSKLTKPTILGHEYAGTVEEVGAEADRSLVGKRVAVEPGIPCLECEWCRHGQYNVCLNMFFPGGPDCDGALREYMTVHAEFCFPIPDTLTWAEAVMIEPLAVAVHAVELANVQPGETAAVLGLGPIGLLTAQMLKLSGAESVFGTDLHDYRVDAGGKNGVDYVFNAVKIDTVEAIIRETGGRGVDVAFDMARSSETISLACRVVRPAGRCVLTGISGEEYDPIPVCVSRRKELAIQWCRRFKDNYPTAISLVESGKIDVRSLVTHSFPLEKAREAFELVSNFEDNVLKASIDRNTRPSRVCA